MGSNSDILPAQCCTLPPLKSSYSPVGETFAILGKERKPIEIYSVGPSDAEYGLLCVFDIFGMTPNTKQGCDALSKATGYRVVLPDFFRGEAWDHTNFPPREGREFLQAWIRQRGAWPLIKPDIEKVVEMMKSDGQTKLGVSTDHPGKIPCSGSRFPLV